MRQWKFPFHNPGKKLPDQYHSTPISSGLLLWETPTTMNDEQSVTEKEQAKKVEQLHWDARHWKSTLRFMQDEILFIDRLLNSYVFEPNTSNLFERLQDYQRRLKNAKNKKIEVIQQISAHENDLGGMLECKDKACDLGFYQKHNTLKAGVVGCVEDFRNLKAEIFNYAGGILKKRKPTK